MAKAYLYSLTDTWDNAATTFNAIRMSVTDTASAAASLLMDLQVGGSSQFKVSKAGKTLAGDGLAYAFVNASNTGIGRTANDLTLYSGATPTARLFGTGFAVSSDNSIGFTSGLVASTTADLTLFRDAANTLAQRNGTSAQTFRLYNTYTDASNYERAGAVWFGNIFYLGTQAAGTGTGSREIIFFTNGTNRWSIGGSSGNLLAATDNTYDIGASGANRPRDLFLGRNFASAGYVWPSYLRLDDAGGTNGVRLYRAGSGILTLYNTAETDFSRLQFGGTTNAFPALRRNGTTLDCRLADDSGGAQFTASTLSSAGAVTAFNATAIPAGGTTGAGLRVSSTANFGVFFGSGAPTLSAAKGSLYLRSDGTTTNDRMYVNTDGATTWTAVTTAA